jgi:hypothetical protein
MTLLAIGRCIGKSKNWNQHEPTITEIMSDSITVAMMEADGVDQSHSKRSYVASRKTTVIWRRTKSAFAVQNVAFDDPVLQYLKQRADIGTAASRTSCSVEMLRCFADSGPSGLEGDEVARHPRHRTTRPFVARRGANVRDPAKLGYFATLCREGPSYGFKSLRRTSGRLWTDVGATSA